MPRRWHGAKRRKGVADVAPAPFASRLVWQGNRLCIRQGTETISDPSRNVLLTGQRSAISNKPGRCAWDKSPISVITVEPVRFILVRCCAA